jgi:hypothetical protein
MELSSNFVNAGVDLGEPAGLNMSTSSFPIQQQSMRNWCWAACTSSISTFYNDMPVLSQPQLEAALNNKPACAFGPLIEYCDDMANLADSLSYIGHLREEDDNVLPSADVVAALASGNPIGVQLNIPGIGGHAVIIVEAANAGGRTVIQVADPAKGQINTMYYEDLRDNYLGNGGTWDKSYKTK